MAGPKIPLEQVIRIAEFRAALRTFVHQSEQIAARCGLTPQRYLLLLTIKGAPSGEQRLSFTELGKRLKLSQNATTDLVARAEQVGLVTREPSQSDGRVVYLRLTPDGESRLNRALIESEAVRHEFASAFEAVASAFESSPTP